MSDAIRKQRDGRSGDAPGGDSPRDELWFARCEAGQEAGPGATPSPIAGAPDARIEIPSQPAYLAPLRAFVSALAARCGFDEVTQFQLALAVDEAVANVINHGYDRNPDGRIWISVWNEPEDRPGLRFVLEDAGRQVDPGTIRSRQLEDIRPGGLGVHIIREVMDQCQWERRDAGGMRLTLVKHLAHGVAHARAEDRRERPGSRD
ncbi:MAG TPA: ATP-binding protein [Phycisphaerales bacterium]|nr:ATP-binding protein [Phycisphaerales bacterium]HMP37662.1 ATP-binding protein [Phycisphaerales bacterium]